MAVASMTGYAVVTEPTELGSVTFECRSVNSRFLDLTLRLEEDLRFAEPTLRETLQTQLARGKVELRGSVTPDEHSAPVSINMALLDRIADLQATVRQRLPQARELSVADLLKMPGVMVTQAVDEVKLEEQIRSLLLNVIASLKAAREREGAALAEILLNNCTQIDAIVKELRAEIPSIIAHIQGKLEERLNEALSGVLSEKSTLTKDDVAERIRQEVTLYAVRLDVEEEMNRLLTHTAEVRRILTKGGAVGRRLDFVVQEMNREANTLGSKAAAIEMTNTALSLKVIIEQMREQIQNLE